MSGLPLAARARADKATINALERCFDFVEANADTILREQIASEDDRKFCVLDGRDAGQFAWEHIPDAVNIGSRQFVAQRAKLPGEKTILACRNAGSFAARVAMALRGDGIENVRLPHGGDNEWKARGGLEA